MLRLWKTKQEKHHRQRTNRTQRSHTSLHPLGHLSKARTIVSWPLRVSRSRTCPSIPEIALSFLPVPPSSVTRVTIFNQESSTRSNPNTDPPMYEYERFLRDLDSGRSFFTSARRDANKLQTVQKPCCHHRCLLKRYGRWMTLVIVTNQKQQELIWPTLWSMCLLIHCYTICCEGWSLARSIES